MPAPCPKCGGVKIEPGEPGLLYWLAEVLGYRLRICGRCRGYRLFRIREKGRSHSSHRHRAHAGTSTEASREGEASPPPESAPAALQAEADPGKPAETRAEPRPETPAEGGRLDLCPWCGSQEYRRSHRTWWERRLGKPPMYRCQECGQRFPREED